MIAVCGAAFVAVAGCADDSSGSGSGTTADPRGIFAPTTAIDVGYRTCDVLPVEEVNAALGLSLVGAQVPISGDKRACLYGNADQGGEVVVTIVVSATASAADARYALMVHETSGTPVDGVGDRAVIAPFSDRLASQQGLVVADIQVSGTVLLETDGAELSAAVARALAAGATVTLPTP